MKSEKIQFQHSTWFYIQFLPHCKRWRWRGKNWFTPALKSISKPPPTLKASSPPWMVHERVENLNQVMWLINQMAANQHKKTSIQHRHIALHTQLTLRRIVSAGIINRKKIEWLMIVSAMLFPFYMVRLVDSLCIQLTGMEWSFFCILMGEGGLEWGVRCVFIYFEDVLRYFS